MEKVYRYSQKKPRDGQVVLFLVKKNVKMMGCYHEWWYGFYKRNDETFWEEDGDYGVSAEDIVCWAPEPELPTWAINEWKNGSEKPVVSPIESINHWQTTD